MNRIRRTEVTAPSKALVDHFILNGIEIATHGIEINRLTYLMPRDNGGWIWARRPLAHPQLISSRSEPARYHRTYTLLI